MAKISLTEPLSGYNLAAINANFVAIEAEFQDKVLYRNNPVGEANNLETDVDANSKRIYNLPEPTLASEAARLQDVQNAIAGASQANLIASTPAGGLAATNVQAALNELDTEKVRLDDLAASTGAGLIGWIQTGVGAVVRWVRDKLRERVSVFDFMTAAQIADVQAGTLLVDVSAPVQLAFNAISAGTKLIFPPGLYKVTEYLELLSKSDFSIDMQGTIVPSGAGVTSVSFGLLDIRSCTDFYIRPRIVNASFTSTLNCIYLGACTDGVIKGGKIDVKYNSIDGTAGIQITANCDRIDIVGNYIRSGYGVLVNNIAGVSNINIEGNTFVGQVAYGNTGPGDAIEFNTATSGSSTVRVVGNRFSGFEYVDANRTTVTGFSNVSGLVFKGNHFDDITGMIAFHCEDGASHVNASHNVVKTAHIGFNIVTNTTKNLRGISVTKNSILMPTNNAASTYATGHGIRAVTNQLAGGGLVYDLDVSDNTIVCTTILAKNGILIQDHFNGTICRNMVDGFEEYGLQVYPSNASSSGIKNCVITNNVAINSVLGNLKFARGAPGSTYADVTTFINVLVKDNIQNAAANRSQDDYFIGDVASENYHPSRRKFLNGKNVATDNTATTAFTLTVPNVTCQGTIAVKYSCTIVGQANRVTESGVYVFAFGRVAGVNLKIAASSKTANAQVAVNGAGTITVSMAAAAVSGAVGATNTIAIQWTSVDGTANVTKAGSDFAFEVETITHGGIGAGQITIT